MKKRWLYQWCALVLALFGLAVVCACAALALPRGQMVAVALGALCSALGLTLLVWQVFLPMRALERLFADDRLTPSVFFQALANTTRLVDTPIGQAVRARGEQLEEHYLADLDTTQAELSALQSQINPHFLYNTLDSIRGQALYQGAHDVADMTEALSVFFRYSVSQKSAVVPLSQELDNVKAYFKIQQFRFNNRFQLYVQVQNRQDLEQCFLPKLSIQPVVENAIVHGLERKVGEGEITITVESTAKVIQITISDNGIGMSPEALGRLQKKVRKLRAESAAPEEGKQSSGIGLGNVAHRIALLYGAQFPVNVMSTQGVGTDVVLTLPRGKELGQDEDGFDSNGAAGLGKK